MLNRNSSIVSDLANLNSSRNEFCDKSTVKNDLEHILGCLVDELTELEIDQIGVMANCQYLESFLENYYDTPKNERHFSYEGHMEIFAKAQESFLVEKQ